MQKHKFINYMLSQVGILWFLVCTILNLAAFILVLLLCAAHAQRVNHCLQCSMQGTQLIGQEKDFKRCRKRGNNKSEKQLQNQVMPRLPGSPFKLIRKQPPEVFYCCVRKLKRCSQKFLTKFTRKAPVFESLFQNLFKKRLWHSCFPVNFAKFLRTPFSQNTLLLALAGRLGDCCFLLLIFLSTSFHLFTTQLFFMIAVAIFPVFCFLFLKLNLFPALHLCYVLPFLLSTVVRLCY